jgi:hypothetical protein
MTLGRRRRRRRSVVAFASGVAAVAVLVSTNAAAASPFATSVARPTGSFASATLQPVGNVAVTWWCPGHGAGYTATIGWADSPSTFVQAYLVEWSPTAAGPWAELSTTTSTAVQQTSIAKKTDRWWRVTSVAYAWRSAAVTVSGTAPAPNC